MGTYVFSALAKFTSEILCDICDNKRECPFATCENDEMECPAYTYIDEHNG